MAVRNKQSKSVHISPQAKDDIGNILNHLSQSWNQKVVEEFLEKLETFYYIVSINPASLGISINKEISESLLSPNKILFITETKERRFR